MQACSEMVAHVMTMGPPPGPAWARVTLDRVAQLAQAIEDTAEKQKRVDHNLDVLCAFMQTDYSGALDGRQREGYTRDRETTLLRAARLIGEARKGVTLEALLPLLGDLYGPEE